MKIVNPVTENSTLSVHVQNENNQINVLHIDGAGTTQVTGAYINNDAWRTVAVCRYVDASNYAFNLPIASYQGQEIEVYADGGTIEIFLWQGTFLDGSSSLSVAAGARFISVIPHGVFTPTWARIG